MLKITNPWELIAEKEPASSAPAGGEPTKTKVSFEYPLFFLMVSNKSLIFLSLFGPAIPSLLVPLLFYSPVVYSDRKRRRRVELLRRKLSYRIFKTMELLHPQPKMLLGCGSSFLQFKKKNGKK